MLRKILSHSPFRGAAVQRTHQDLIQTGGTDGDFKYASPEARRGDGGEGREIVRTFNVIKRVARLVSAPRPPSREMKLRSTKWPGCKEPVTQHESRTLF